MNPSHSRDARDKIGASVHASAWRKRVGDKSAELQSPGFWEVDFATPRVRRNPHFLFEEVRDAD
jgi:hypothetical protein